MIITGLDSHSIQVAMDAKQAKMLVELLRRQDSIPLLAASIAMQKYGFGVLATDINVAAKSFAAVVGTFTDQVTNLPNPEPQSKDNDPDTIKKGEPTPTVN